MTDQHTVKQTSLWQPAFTAPINGDEFWYWSRGRLRVGSLGSDCGGSIKRDPGMTAWHPKLPWYHPDAGSETPPGEPPEHLR